MSEPSLSPSIGSLPAQRFEPIEGVWSALPTPFTMKGELDMQLNKSQDIQKMAEAKIKVELMNQ